MVVHVTCKNEDPIENEVARVLTNFFPIITLWELSAAMETRVSDHMCFKTKCRQSPTKMLLLIKFNSLMVTEIFIIEWTEAHMPA